MFPELYAHELKMKAFRSHTFEGSLNQPSNYMNRIANGYLTPGILDILGYTYKMWILSNKEVWWSATVEGDEWVIEESAGSQGISSVFVFGAPLQMSNMRKSGEGKLEWT